MSQSGYTKDKISEIDHTSQLIRELAFLDDERDIYWYPSVVNMGKLGIIYPDGIPSNWVWKMARVVKVDEEEKMNYPVPGKDDDNAVEFGRYEFLKACQTMGIVKDGINTNGVS